MIQPLHKVDMRAAWSDIEEQSRRLDEALDHALDIDPYAPGDLFDNVKSLVFEINHKIKRRAMELHRA